MLRQLPYIKKITSSLLTYLEMGDIICDSTDNFTITLPDPNQGLWYRISNVNSGIIAIEYDSNILFTLEQSQQCLLLANNTSSWFFSMGGGEGSSGEGIFDSPSTNVLALNQFKINDVAYTVDSICAYVDEVYADDTKSDFIINTPKAIEFSPDGSLLIVAGQGNTAKAYSVSGTILTFISNIYADNIETELDNDVYCCKFSPDGNSLVLGGLFTDYAKVYSVSGTTITFVSNIYADAGTTSLNSSVETYDFSPSGDVLVMGGSFTNHAKIYSISGTTITFINDIPGFSYRVEDIKFSPSGDALVIVGPFTSYAKVYSVSGTTITFVSNIYADNVETPLSSWVRCLAFSPDGAILILGGSFTERAKLYSISGTTVTFISNIYADEELTIFDNSIDDINFSPDGNILILCGNFLGSAKSYMVSGTTINFASNIYMDAKNNEFPYSLDKAAISPDNNTLILGGTMPSSYVKIYTLLDSVYKIAYLITTDPLDTYNEIYLIEADTEIFNEVDAKKLNGDIFNILKKVVPPLAPVIEDIGFYISQDSGDDTGIGDYDNPFQTFERVLQVMPNYLNDQSEILIYFIESATSYSAISLSQDNLKGNGILSLHSDYCLMEDINISLENIKTIVDIGEMTVTSNLNIWIDTDILITEIECQGSCGLRTLQDLKVIDSTFNEALDYYYSGNGFGHIYFNNCTFNGDYVFGEYSELNNVRVDFVNCNFTGGILNPSNTDTLYFDYTIDGKSSASSMVLTNLSTITATEVIETDSVLEAIGKLQAQINALI